MNLIKERNFRLPLLWILSLVFVLGVLLRVTFVNDMEYKEDEEYNFTQTQLIGNSQPWPWYGIPSGVYLVNPGMSIWAFAVLAKLFGIHQPTSLATAVQLFALLGMSLIIPFALRWVPKKDQGTWFWAFAFSMVNPFLVLYQRKLWPEPFLPFFTMLTLMGWWNRHRRFGAVIWGMMGAWLGQIHMSGFFFSAALFIWTALFDPSRKRGTEYQEKGGRSHVTNWSYWFLGSILGALPLVPWLIYILEHPIQQSMSAGWNEIIQLKYWTFWFTDPTGLHLGNPLGLMRGPSHWDQISDFARYPLWNGEATYFIGFAHLIAVSATAGIFLRGLVSLYQTWILRKEARFKSLVIGEESQTAFLQNSALWGCGLLLTATGVVIRRYYMTVTFPLEFIWLARMAKDKTRSGRGLLLALWMAELAISAGFVYYIHVNQGSTQGDYGPAYHLLKK